MTGTPPPGGEAAPEVVRFRPSKKRKVYRQTRDSDDDQDHSHEHNSTEVSKAREAPEGGSTVGDNDPDDEDNHGAEASAVAAAIRMRNARKSRGMRGGVGFTASGAARQDGDDAHSTERALVPVAHDETASGDVSSTAASGGIPNRFTHQTGFITAIDDKHMTAYIESRLSTRDATRGSTSHSGLATADAAADEDTATLSATEPPSSAAATVGLGNSAKQGKLLEVDLPDGAFSRGRFGRGQGDAAPRNKKPRLGPDGKPWRSRKRRGSDDIKRDQLVEEFLHENRLDVYDNSKNEASTKAAEDDSADGTADDRLAEQFRRQYMDDMAQRRQRRKPAAPAKHAPTEDVLKGPKLGGSRNSRAAMRDLLLKKEKEKEGRK